MDTNGRARQGVGMVAALVIAIGALGIGIASAQTSGDTYTGCLRPTGKLVKVRIGDDPLAPCIDPAVEVSWGEIGPQGPPGQQGIQGAPGISGYEIATFVKNQPSTAGAESVTYTASCPAGKTVLGGGASVLGDHNGDGIYDAAWNTYGFAQSYPLSDGTGWRATTDLTNPVGDPYQITVFAICANVAA